MNAVTRRARLTVAYDGAAFHGFAKDPHVPTVAAALEAALSTVSRMPVAIVGAGRTDAGVHAWGQVVSLDLPADSDLVGLQRRVNRMCGRKLAVRCLEWAPTADFHARFDAVWRHYRYTILNTPTPNPFLVNTTWHVTQPLNLHLMQLACDPFIGEHDFSSFCRRPKSDPNRKVDGLTVQRPRSMVRNVLLAEWSDVGEGQLRLDIRATAFCHQQVRALTGTMVDVGLGNLTAGEISGILRAKNRDHSSQLAPPSGLCLWEVGYAV